MQYFESSLQRALNAIAMNDLLDASVDISKPFQVISATEWSQMEKTISDT